MRFALLLSCIAVSLAGCFPAVAVEQPAIIGHVVDRNGGPAGATAVLLRADHGGPVIACTKTDANGLFRQPAGDGRWFVYFLPQDNPPPPVYIVEASSGAACGKAADVTGRQVKPFGVGVTRSVDVGTIELK